MRIKPNNYSAGHGGAARSLGVCLSLSELLEKIVDHLRCPAKRWNEFGEILQSLREAPP